jgi:lysophospholipase
MPIIVADERAPNEVLIPSNTTVFEFNPWEMGSYDLSLSAYAPIAFTGSNFSGGSIYDSNCVTGFDNIGFVVGTSSSLFNQFYLQINSTDAPERVKSAISSILGQWGSQNGDISIWPNPFCGFNDISGVDTCSKYLTLVDGGEDLQNIPFHPLLRRTRNVDVIFAIDSSADTSTNWPNGTSMVATYNRSLITKDTNFPPVPDQNTFINLGLNHQPIFFGCNSTNLTQQIPLVIYLPNTPFTFNSNSSTFDLSYSNSERNSIILNGYNVATRGNSSLDTEWPSCVACAILLRSFTRTNTAPPAKCQDCFHRYCWNGTTNPTVPSVYEPTLIVKTSAAIPLTSVIPLILTFIILFWTVVQVNY